MSLEACLPEELRGPSTTITRIAAGLSGAGVYRVEAAGQAFVLKVSGADEPLEGWRRKLQIRQSVARAGLAPQVLHVDEARRAVLSPFIVDRSFPAFFGDPRTREAALEKLGQMLRRLHGLPLPPDVEPSDPRQFVETLWTGPLAGFSLPPFVVEAVDRVLAEKEPERDRAPVLSHNDVNPTNLVYDGENLLLLDWETAGINDPFHDLAAISIFLRMDEATCLKLLSAYDGKVASVLPAQFAYRRRLVAVLCGIMFLHLARQRGHAGATGEETLESTPSLLEFYQRMRTGALNIASAEGQWGFGLALVKAAATL